MNNGTTLANIARNHAKAAALLADLRAMLHESELENARMMALVGR